MAQVYPSARSVRPSTPPTQTRSKMPFLSPSAIPEPGLAGSSYKSNGMNLDAFSPVNQNGSFEFDRVIKSGKVNRRVKKKGAWKPTWKAAYLVLRPNLLSVYKNQDETELKASITLSDVTAVAPVKKLHTENVFGVFSPAKNFQFAGISARDTADWLAAIRFESRTEEQDALSPPNPGFHGPENTGYETTDLSADDDLDAPDSPEAPQWTVRGNKSRSNTQGRSTTSRRPSTFQDYSGNEMYTTSHSDFSDTLPGSTAGTNPYLSTSIPKQTSPLTPIPDDKQLSRRPSTNRNISQLSDIGNNNKQGSQSSDPSRVVRHGYVQLLKTTSGVKQWKSIWIVLRQQSLALYKSKDEYSPLKIIPMYSIVDAAEIDPLSKSKQYCLQIISDEKSYRLSVDKEDDLVGWLGALKSVLTRHEAEKDIRSANVHSSASNNPTINAAVTVNSQNQSRIRAQSIPKGKERVDGPVLPDIMEGTRTLEIS